MQTKRKIEEMADLLALTPQTVMKALINDSGVSHKTRDLVFRMAKDIGITTTRIENNIIIDGLVSTDEL